MALLICLIFSARARAGSGKNENMIRPLARIFLMGLLVPCAGAQTAVPVSTVSECVYTQQQPIVRHRILSGTSYTYRSGRVREKKVTTISFH